jgi:NADPH-dependent 2,4-dienoyl-CoA reductase/sulfur reductase-like enzyme
MEARQIIRQGDVCLIEVSAIPSNAKEVTPDGDVILAYGEVTGHAHRIVQTKTAPKVRVWDAAGERFLQRVIDAPLTHEEHSTALLDKPFYRQIHQVEERGEVVRRVAD